MTDKNLSDKVEKIATSMREAMRREDPDYSDGEFLADMSRYIRDLENLSPDPPLPTMADMSMEERASCRWMQADVMNRRVRYVIANPFDDDYDAGMVSAEGEIEWFPAACVTPRPDLPRMAWPRTEKPAPDLPVGWRVADHKENGRVIVTNTNPDRDGRVYYMLASENRFGYDSLFCYPEDLTYLDQ